MPLTMGPSVWPISIVVERNPIEAPTKVTGTRSQTIGAVEESTAAKEIPYTTANKSSRENCVVKGIAATKTQQAIIPIVIGLVRPILSDSLPIKGLATTNAAS